MIKKITLLCAIFVASVSYSQEYVHQVLVLNEGYWDWSAGQQVVPVSIGKYDPSTQVYSTVATVSDARFGSDILVTDDAVFVAADTLLLKYDKDNFQLLDQATIVGIREFAEWNGQLVITRGELGGLSHYAEVRSTSDLSLQYAIMPSDGLQWSCEGVFIEDDIAYLAINNAFDWSNLVGKVGQIDLVSGNYLGDIDLGPNGLNPENVMYSNGKFYTLNNKDFSGSSISVIDKASAVLDATLDISLTSGCGASVMADDHVYFQEYDLGKVSRFELNNNSILDTLSATDSYYGMEDSPVEQVIYATKTDFVSTGELVVLDYNGTIQSTIPAGVSGGNLSIDVRSTTGVFVSDPQALSVVYFDGIITLPSTDPYVLRSTSGQLVVQGRSASGKTVSVQHLPEGLYIIEQSGRVGRFVK